MSVEFDTPLESRMNAYHESAMNARQTRDGHVIWYLASLSGGRRLVKLHYADFTVDRVLFGPIQRLIPDCGGDHNRIYLAGTLETQTTSGFFYILNLDGSVALLVPAGVQSSTTSYVAEGCGGTSNKCYTTVQELHQQESPERAVFLLQERSPETLEVLRQIALRTIVETSLLDRSLSCDGDAAKLWVSTRDLHWNIGDEEIIAYVSEFDVDTFEELRRIPHPRNGSVFVGGGKTLLLTTKPSGTASDVGSWIDELNQNDFSIKRSSDRRAAGEISAGGIGGK